MAFPAPIRSILENPFRLVYFGISSIPSPRNFLRPTVSTIALGIALALSTIPAAQAYSEVVSFTYDGRTYKAYNNTSPITWSEARAYALSVGGDLVSLNTLAENTAVFAQIGYSSFPSLWNSVPGSLFVGPYIGLFQPIATDVTTGWRWVDGSLLGSDSWYPGQPDNGYGVENVALYFNQVSQWADIYDCSTTSVPCSANNQPANDYRSQSFIVEFDPVPVPAPVPMFGAIAALGWARRLRSRAKSINI